jgi:hypothetical protein
MDPLSELLNRPLRPYLYHYTSIIGLQGILNDGIIWASMIHYLNDSAEFTYAMDVFRLILDDRRKKISDGRLNELIDQLNESLELIARIPIFVCSLTEQEDLLSQWRGYCPPGGGYCIGFQSEPLRECLSHQGFILVPCLYDAVLQCAVMTPVVEEALSELQRVAASSPNLRAGELMEWGEFEFVKNFCRAAPVIKNSSFREEQEWRAISGRIELDHPQLKFRAGRALLIPYFDVRLDFKQITLDFVVGPNTHSELARSSLKMLVDKYRLERDLPVDDIRVSEIPLRQI